MVILLVMMLMDTETTMLMLILEEEEKNGDADPVNDSAEFGGPLIMILMSILK